MGSWACNMKFRMASQYEAFLRCSLCVKAATQGPPDVQRFSTNSNLQCPKNRHDFAKDFELWAFHSTEFWWSSKISLEFQGTFPMPTPPGSSTHHFPNLHLFGLKTLILQGVVIKFTSDSWKSLPWPITAIEGVFGYLGLFTEFWAWSLYINVLKKCVCFVFVRVGMFYNNSLVLKEAPHKNCL